MGKDYKTWYYDGDADLTIGETKSKAWLAIIITLAITIITGIISIIIFRGTIYDFLVNPRLVPVENLNLEVGTPFIPKNYVTNPYGGDIQIIYPNEDSVDIHKLGDYNVKYVSKNSLYTNDLDLTIKVVDTQAPIIQLKNKSITLIRGKQTQDFNPESEIKDITDNYYPRDMLKVEWTKALDFNMDNVQVVYTVTDPSDNQSSATLDIKVENPKEEKPSTNAQPQQSKPSTNSQPSTNSGYTSSNNYVQAPKRKFIDGVRDITVKRGTSVGQLKARLIENVVGSGTITVDCSSVNLATPGKYTATYRSSDGITKTCTVTVT